MLDYMQGLCTEFYVKLTKKICHYVKVCDDLWYYCSIGRYKFILTQMNEYVVQLKI